MFQNLFETPGRESLVENSREIALSRYTHSMFAGMIWLDLNSRL